MKRSVCSTLLLTVLLAFLLTACLGDTTPTPSPIEGVECLPEGERLTAELVRITDGDTIVVKLNGEEVRVRYIGIDTPEVDEPLGPEATQANADLLGAGPLTLVRDQSAADRFGRMLAYVLTDEQFINYALVRAGWAESRAYPPDTTCQGTFDEAQSQARADALGLWAPLPTATPGLRSEGISLTPAANCDPSYPDICIPSPPPDLNCQDITGHNFRVLPPDPHGLDRDGNGLGCEGNE